MSRSLMPSAFIAFRTSPIAAELASRAARAVSASRLTVRSSTAISGSSCTLPSPLTLMRGSAAPSTDPPQAVRASSSGAASKRMAYRHCDRRFTVVSPLGNCR